MRVDLALIHYPVCNRNREIIGSAVTNLDLHDIARAGRTFGIDKYYLVTPFADQQRLVREILDHWRTGYGAAYNACRKEALSIVGLCADVAALYEEVTAKWRQRPTVLATSAADSANLLGYDEVRARIFKGEPMLLLFGTGWGMAPELLAGVDGFLPPLKGAAEYNHLSVRSAAAIILDRLLGER
ncbi:MAG: RNA methyltransferase [Desulfurivibrionaceae bacterium]|nr:RNA methyltransferase [Desulfobulbales bacterium]MDT8335538.1 RNA methyltransferase [Desulfurivibrionaceae bacterium]